MTSTRPRRGVTDGPRPGDRPGRADGRVLMLAWVDAEALAATFATGEVHFHSRSRGRLWRKGEESGNVLRLRRSRSIATATRCCSRSTRPARPATAGRARASILTASPVESDGQGFAWLESLWSTLADGAPSSGRRARTRSRLLDGGVDAVGRKVTEEATEVLLAAKNDAAGDRRRPDGDAHAARRRGGRPAVPRAGAPGRARRASPSTVLDELRRRHTE